MPVSTPPPSPSASTSAWNGGRLAAVERRGPDGDRRALLDLAQLADHAAGAAADELRRARAPRGRPRASPRAPRDARRRRTRPRGRTARRRARRGRPRRPRRRRSARPAPSRAGCPMPARPWPRPTVLRSCRRARPAARRALRPHRRRQDRRRDRAGRAAARARGGSRSRSPPTRCSSTRAWRSSPAPPTPRERRGSSTGCSASCRSPRAPPPGDFARRAHAEIDGLIAGGRRPIVVGGTGLYLRAALAELDLRPPADPAIRERYAGGRARGRAGAARRARRARPGGRRRDRADRRPARRPRARAARRRASARRAGAQLWTAETRHPTLLVALVMDRERALPPDRRPRRGDGRRRRRRGGPAARTPPAPRPPPRQALGFEELLRGDVEAMQPRTRRYAKRQLTWLRKLPGAHHDRRHRRARRRTSPPRDRRRAAMMRADAVREVAGAGQRLPDRGGDRAPLRAHAAARAPAVRPPHGPGADGVLELSPPDAPASSPGCASSTRTASEAELSGNGAREAILYLRRAGWTDAGRSSRSRRRRARSGPTILGPTRAASTWAARALALRELPRRRRRTAPARSAGCALPARRRSATRSARSASTDRAELAALDLPAIGPPIEHDPQFPNRTNVSFWTRPAPGRDPRAHLRARRGGDAVVAAPARAARRSPSRCAAATRP